MALARFKDLCIDANDPNLIGNFWASALGRSWEQGSGGEGRLIGPTPQHTVWVNRVPEQKSVKHRVHWDIYARSLADLEERGATVVDPRHDDWPWTLMADPEGGEFDAFLRDDLPEERLHGLVVDSADPGAQARWWAEVYGASVVDDPRGYSSTTEIPGMPILTMDFVPVPETKQVKNRIHWDVAVDDLEPLVAFGATVIRPQGDDRRWHVLADPEGNEFCAFVHETDL